MRITAYAHASKESMYDKGEKAGLTGEALRMFAYALSEVKFDLEVDEKTGLAEIVSVDGKPLARL